MRRVGLTDSLKIMVTNAFQLLTGSRGVDGAPVADVGKYNVRLCGRKGLGCVWMWMEWREEGWSLDRIECVDVLSRSPCSLTHPHTLNHHIQQGSWTTFLSKVMSGQLEELAGGPLFLLLAEYYKRHGPIYKLMFGPRYALTTVYCGRVCMWSWWWR